MQSSIAATYHLSIDNQVTCICHAMFATWTECPLRTKFLNDCFALIAAIKVSFGHLDADT
ncbi:hypothetical protein A9K65_031840 [Mesorhizobium sp. WSM1497]|nr:hypothetical protein A9K65_031840 [Mesorhizobium sp. WSM1497]